MSLPEKILDVIVRKSKRVQDYINYRAEPFNMKWEVSRNRGTIQQALRDYRYYDIRPDDTILDIGACCGGFGLFASLQVPHGRVYCIEPIVTDELQKNIIKNNIKNITVINEALGVGNYNISWMGKTKTVKGKSLTELKEMCGSHINFLKCNCEGGEWRINPRELRGIRRIEMEVHGFKGMPNTHEYKRILDKAGFKYEFEEINNNMALVHAIAR